MSKIMVNGGVLFALAFSVALQGSVIGNGPPNQTNGSDLNAFLEADNFTLAGSFSIVQVSYWTLQGDATDYAGTTAWSFYQNLSGVPGAVVAAGNTAAAGVATGNTAFGLNEFLYTFAVNVPLGAGTYWLGLHNGPAATQPATNYNWAWSADTGDSQSQDLSAPSGWVTNSAELAFQLTANAIPEPASVSLFGSGLLAAWLFRRRAGVRG